MAVLCGAVRYGTAGRLYAVLREGGEEECAALYCFVFFLHVPAYMIILALQVLVVYMVKTSGRGERLTPALGQQSCVP